MTTPEWLYHYRAVVRSVYDGDTITVDVDLGLESWLHGQSLRLYGINTPELRRPTRKAGLAARDFLRLLIPDNSVIYIQTQIRSPARPWWKIWRRGRDKRGKYGRYLATVWTRNEETGSWTDVNQLLVDTGHAVEYMRR